MRELAGRSLFRVSKRIFLELEGSLDSDERRRRLERGLVISLPCVDRAFEGTSSAHNSEPS